MPAWKPCSPYSPARFIRLFEMNNSELPLPPEVCPPVDTSLIERFANHELTNTEVSQVAYMAALYSNWRDALESALEQNNDSIN